MNVIRQTPNVTPDSMRQKLHMDERLFNGYTPKSFGYTATNQTQYSSNIQNWGSELLLETRKLKLDRPPLGDIQLLSTSEDAFKQFFELKYSDNRDSYEQECCVMAILKKGVLHNRKVYLTFTNVKKVILPRALSDSENKVYPHVVWKTTSPPFLHVQAYEGSEDYDVFPLVAYHTASESPTSTTYWFENTTPFGTDATLEEMLIASDTSTISTEGELQTVTFETWMEELPFIWMTFDNLRSLPTIGFNGNTGNQDWPILTAGTDGHGTHYLFPYAYGEDNTPASGVSTNTRWLIRVHPRYVFNIGTKNDIESNQTQEIDYIEFVGYENDDPFGVDNHRGVVKVTFDNNHVRLRFVEDGIWGFSHWQFRKPVDGDWDYDGTRYQNPIYGYMEYGYTNTSPLLNPIFKIIPQMDVLTDDDVSRHNVAIGIHSDTSSEYSQHAVIKKNGTIFNLGDFDGLPPYYAYKLPRDVSRSHTEMYAIKDRTDVNQNIAMNNYVAAMLIDSAIPQTKMNDIVEDAESAIVFDYANMRTYKTIEDKILTANNIASDIGYINRDTFIDINKKGYQDSQKFIYHGNRIFSLGVMGLDPELETGRVYYLSNDGASYENNEIAIASKPKRTVARICDIPTDMGQLISIKGIAPTLTIDEYYTRSEQAYTLLDRERVWQIINNGVIVHDENGRYIFGAEELLDDTLSYEYMRETYFAPSILNPTITMTDGLHAKNEALDGDYYWTIASGGVDYRVGDTVQGYIAGHIMKGVVATVDGTGSVTEVVAYNPDAPDLQIPVMNFYARDSYIDCFTIKKAQYASKSQGLRLHLHLADHVWPYDSPVLMEQYIRYSHIPNLFTFQFDMLGNIWLYEYQYHEDEKAAIALMVEDLDLGQHDDETDEAYDTRIQSLWDSRDDWREKYLALTGLSWVSVCQMTGDTITDNPYDDMDTRKNRGLFSIMMQKFQWDISKYTFGSSYQYLWAVSNITTVARSEIIDETLDMMMNNYPSEAKALYENAVMEYIDHHAILYEGSYITYKEVGDEEHRNISIYQIYPNINNNREFKLPVAHKAKLHSRGGLSNQLIFANTGKIRNHKNMQPIVYVFNPKSTTYENTMEVTYNISQTTDHYQVLYVDFPQISAGLQLWTEISGSVILDVDVWKYIGYEECTIDQPKHPYHPNVDDDKLPLQKLGNADDVVLRTQNRRYQPLTEQPTGAMHNISIRQYPSAYRTGRGGVYDSELLFFFKLPDDATLQGFHMKDDVTMEDISKYCILLHRKRLYYYNESIDRWKLVSGKETDEDDS